MVQQVQVNEGGKDYDVTCSMEGFPSSSFCVKGDYYGAKIEGLRLYMEERRIPGTPTQYLTGEKRGLITVEAKCRDDRRRAKPAVVPQLSFLIERIDQVRSLVRTSGADSGIKNRCLNHLLNARRELDGLRTSKAGEFTRISEE